MDGATRPLLRFLKRIAVKRLAEDGTRLPLESFSSAWTPAEAAARLRKPGHTLVEFLQSSGIDQGTQPTKLYFDADRWAQSAAPPTQDDAEAFLAEVRELMDTLMDTLSSITPDATYVLAQRHGFCKTKKKHKLSLRAFVLGVAIDQYDDIPRLLATVRGLAHLADAFDMSVYKPSEQLIAAIHGRKGGGDDRVLMPMHRFAPLGAEDADERLLDYVVQHVDPEWPVLSGFKEHEAETLAHAAPAASLLSAHPPDDSDPYVRLVRCLGPRTASDRAQWINVGIALKHALGAGTDRYLPAFLEFSRLGGAKFDGEAECCKTWDGLRERGATAPANSNTSGVHPMHRQLSIGTLRHYAKQENPDAYRAWLAEQRRHAPSPPLASASAPQVVPASTQIAPPEASVRKCAGLMLHALCEDPAALADVANAKVEAGRLDVGTTLGDGRHLSLSLTLQDLAVTEWGEDGAALRTAYVHGKDAIDVIGQELSVVHKHLQLGQVWEVSCPGEGKATFTTKEGPRAKIDLVNMNAEMCAKLEMVESRRTVTEWVHKKHLPMLQSAYNGAVQHALINRMDLGWAINIGCGNNNNSIVNVFNTGGDGGESGPFNTLRTRLCDAAGAHKLRKREGDIYEPIPGCPCAYVKSMDFKRFINTHLDGDPLYMASAQRYDELTKFLNNYEGRAFPALERDLNYLSFANGVLHLPSLRFTPYAEVGEEHPLAAVTARHHIDALYTGDAATPLLDRVLLAQFDAEVAELLYALLGRLFFRVGTLDNWQVMPYLVGVGGTGKSLVLSVVQKLFAPGTVSMLAAKREERFGLANLVGKDLIVGRDMPAKLSGVLSQEDLQCMTAGETMEIARKGLSAIPDFQWTAPVIMASNEMPDYVNRGNNVSRRLVTFRFDHPITSPDEGLLEDIFTSELPAFVCRALTAYHARVELIKGAGNGFWKNVPPPLLEWRNMLSASTSVLHRFLDMDDDERGCRIQRAPDGITWESEFKNTLERCAAMNGERYTSDSAVFATFGLQLARINVCAACNEQPLARGGGGCCDAYAQLGKRGKRWGIKGMRLTALL